MQLSIITVNLNNAKGLAQTIASVASQKDVKIDYIVIDGGSSDNSTAIIEKYASFIDFSVSEKDGGIYQGMNKGIKAARGNYVLFLNSGDTLDSPNVIAKLKQYTTKVNADIYHTDIFLIDEPAKQASILQYPHEVSVNHFITGTISHQTAVIRKTLFEEIGYYNEEYRMASDWAFFLKAAKHGYSFAHIKQLILSNYTLHGFSSNYNLGVKERLNILQSEYPEYLEHYLQAKKKPSLIVRGWLKLGKIARRYNIRAIAKQKQLFYHYQLQRSKELNYLNEHTQG